MEREFRERVWRLLGDYTSSYDPDGAEYEYLMSPGGDNDPHSWPFCRTSPEATEAAEGWRNYIGYCYAGIREYGGRARQAHERMAGALTGLRQAAPWRRRRHAELLDEIAAARNELEAHRQRAMRLQRSTPETERRPQIGSSASCAGRSAQVAAVDAVARALGWRPGKPVIPRRPTFQAGSSGAELVAYTSTATQANVVVPATEGVCPGSQLSATLPFHLPPPAEGSHGPQPRIRFS